MGALVLMIENIIRDCLPLLGLAFVMLMGFVLAIQVMLRSIAHGCNDDDAARLTSAMGSTADDDIANENVNQAYETFPRSTLTLLYALFDDFDSEEYSAEYDLKWLVLTTFSLFMIAQVIVLLNLLISIMADTFERVKSNEEGQMLMARAMIIDSCEASATREEIEEIECTILIVRLQTSFVLRKMTGRYVYAVESVNERSDDIGNGWWTGKFNMLVEKFRAIVMKSKSHVENTIKDEVKILRDELKKEMKTSMQQQEQRIAAIEHQLNQLATEQASTISILTSVISDAEARTEQRFQDVSTKMDRILSFIETQSRL